ncbi:hypothetical protein AAFC00_004145 [Neodothiora populina]|uniref:C2H2-type domain-containing protein n=1 Tax=Neodothiora populina TaxID=2781224 RepID=A0ABR3PIQ3_9PEZI
MNVSSEAYYQPLLFQAQDVSGLDLPVVFSQTSMESEQNMQRLAFQDVESTFNPFDMSYSSPMPCTQTLPDTPLQHWTYSTEEQYTLSPYPRPESLCHSLSPAPADIEWEQHVRSQARAVSRVPSFTSMTSSWTSCEQSCHTRSDISRSASPNANEMARWGKQEGQGRWRCAYPGCTSKSTFCRGCDLRKHYRRHTKSLFCRNPECKQSREGGFSSEKDRARHEAKHDPKIRCEWKNCSRVFSRVDNMRDHVKRIHRRRQNK